jgi:hypothetical protein
MLNLNDMSVVNIGYFLQYSSMHKRSKLSLISSSIIGNTSSISVSYLYLQTLAFRSVLHLYSDWLYQLLIHTYVLFYYGE